MTRANLPPGVAEAFQLQAEWCRLLGSELYAEIIERATTDLNAGGRVARLMEGWSGNPVPDALVLRLMGAVHHLVLSGDAPVLARHYPSAGGTPRWPHAWQAFLDVLEEHEELLRQRLARGVQTNEVNRSAALLGGFLHVASATGRALALRELGSSAGLNLGWDRYRYELAPETVADPYRWGDPLAPVLVRATWEGPAPRLDGRVAVLDRAGCDVAPVDIGDDAQLRLLESFVWPDQVERLAMLRAAAALARRHPVRIDRAGAASWLERELDARPPTAAMVVFHSIIWWYLGEEERSRVQELLEEAGRRATPEAPLAWLRMEVLGRQEADVRLRLWPPGDDLLLGVADPHGRRVHWGAP